MRRFVPITVAATALVAGLTIAAPHLWQSEPTVADPPSFSVVGYESVSDRIPCQWEDSPFGSISYEGATYKWATNVGGTRAQSCSTQSGCAPRTTDWTSRTVFVGNTGDEALVREERFEDEVLTFCGMWHFAAIDDD